MKTSGMYEGKIKVICTKDMMCFPVNPETLEATSCSVYDPYAISDPEPGVQTMYYSEYIRLKNKMRDEQMKGRRV